jgi:hypothetical protein
MPGLDPGMTMQRLSGPEFQAETLLRDAPLEGFSGSF